MKVKTAGFVFIVLFACALSLAADDREIARSTFHVAKDLYSRGGRDGALKLLEESIDFYPAYSETLFLSGKIMCERQETTAPGIGRIERALKLNSWTETPASEAQAELASAYLRTKRFREALAIFNRLRANSIYSSTNETARAQAAAGANDSAGADAIFTATLEAFPGDKETCVAFIQSLLARGRIARASEIVGRGIREFPDEPRFTFYQLGLTRDQKIRKNLFALYLSQGGHNPAVVLMLTDADNTAFQNALDFFFNRQGDSSVLLIEALMNGLKKNKLRAEAAARRLGALNGDKFVDADNDGFYEERYTFRNNELAAASFDRNQDGIPEAVIDFENNKPKSIAVQVAADEKTTFQYNGYPRLAAVRIDRKNGHVEYGLIPDALVFSPLKAMPAPAEFKLRLAWPAAPSAPNEQTIARAAFALTESPLDPKRPVRKWDLFFGNKRVLHEDADRDGIFEHVVIYGENGTALSGMIDTDNDGYFEAREIYVKGVRSGLEYDERRDGKFGYRENASGGEKSWDLNGDGKPDVIERRTPNGKIVWDYSGFLQRSK